MEWGWLVKPAIVRVQNAWAQFRLSLSIWLSERVNGLPRGFEQQVIGFVLMIQADSAGAP